MGSAVVVVVGDLCRIKGKRHSGAILLLFGFGFGMVEGEGRVEGGRVVMSSASQADGSCGEEEGGSVVLVMWAESLRAEAQRVDESEMREWRSFLRSADSEGVVSGLRIVRIRWTVESI